jgi:hypothetical protein
MDETRRIILRRILWKEYVRMGSVKYRSLILEVKNGRTALKNCSSFLGSTAQLRPWPLPQNPAEFLGGFSTIFFFTV